MPAWSLPTTARYIVTVVSGAAFVVLGVFAVERTAHHDDAAQYWMMAGRLARTGDPFYVAAVDHKGPIWVGAYRLGYAITGDQRWFWFIMAALVVALAAITAIATALLLRDMAVGRTTSFVASAALGIYLVFGPEGYSDALYGRNITAALTAAGVALLYRCVAADASHAALCAGAAGVLMGLATQTVLTTAATTVLLGGGAWHAARTAGARTRPLAWYLSGALAGFASGPIWYAAKGESDAFRTYFWDYNLTYASTDASPLARFGRAGVELGGHFVTRPFMLVAPIALLLAWRIGRHRPAFVIAGLWWLGELISVSAPDRWFVHYWILLAAPSACLGALAFDQLTTSPVRRRSRLIFLGGLIVVGVYAVPGLGSGVAHAIDFDGIEANHQDRLKRRTVRMQQLQVIVDRHSTPSDPVYIWASVAEPYMALDRPAASRFDRNTWLTGEVYGSDVVATLPGVWDDLLTDLDASTPSLVIEFLESPIDPSSPLAAYLADRYVEHSDATTAANNVRIYLQRPT